MLSMRHLGQGPNLYVSDDSGRSRTQNQASSDVTSESSVILCAGLKSSGSTWLYNAVVQLLEEDRGNDVAKRGSAPMLPFYADSLRDFPARAARAGTMIIKTHRPSSGMEFLTRYVQASVLITVREPRDAIASLMQRFGHRFEPCLSEVSVNGRRIVDLLENGGAVVFRYEQRFYERSESLERLATQLNLKISKQARGRIFRALTAANIKKRITSLSAGGAFGKRPTPDSFDMRTQWHPGHIGDRQIGKYRAFLTLDMQERILAAMGDYCSAFGYPLEPSEEGVAVSQAPSVRKGRLAGTTAIA
jgi:hypothetical protein